MIQVKKGLSKKHLAIIITASVLALLITGYIVVEAIINSRTTDGGNSGVNRPEILEGEDIYSNAAVVYPYVPKANIISIAVTSYDDENGHRESFAMIRPEIKDQESDTVKYDSYFMLYYQDDEGNTVPYYPDILSAEDNISYSDFYAIEGSDGLNVYKIDYLCAAIGALYFDERIPVAASGPERAEQLGRYGLNQESQDTIFIEYVDSDGQQKTHKVFVGDSLITGVGFYFMLEGRDYVYTSAASERFEYLLGDFESFLHSRVVAEGLKSDNIYEPYLTTDYKQWTNHYYSVNNGSTGRPIKNGSEVVALTNVLTPKYTSDGDSNIGDGYKVIQGDTINIDLSYIAGRPGFDRMIQALLASKVGDKDIVASIITNSNSAELGKTYTYTINYIEAVLTDEGEISAKRSSIEGKKYDVSDYTVGENNLVKVEYEYYVDGVLASDEPCHAIIDLSADSVISDDIKERVRAGKVGEYLGVSFDAVYDENNSAKRKYQSIITDIVLITKIVDGQIIYLDEVTEDCIVTYDYKDVVDGFETGTKGRKTVDLSKITEGDNLSIKNKLIGRGLEANVDLTVIEEEICCQAFADFITYEIKEIKGYVEKEIVVSFNFVNASERDPFYGESIYGNTLENANKFYALDDSACQEVVYLLGGVGMGSSSQVSEGLRGTETVAIGLTPANMHYYGLYDGYTVYFELPRGITSITGSGGEGVDDFRHLSTLGFNLYISKKQSDGTRYIGSDMYNIIVKIDGDKFDYLEKSFEEFWARRNLVMIDYNNIDKVEVELGMTSIYGKYEFNLEHKTIYIIGNQHYDEAPEEGGTKYNQVSVNTSILSDTVSESLLSQLLEQSKDDAIMLHHVYDRAAGKLWAVGHDTAGTAYFKEMLRLLYGVSYVDVLSEDEQADAFVNAPKIMSISFTLMNSPYAYSYDFYRVSDRRVMVHLYRTDPSGEIVGGEEEVSGFYISTFAAKKIINGFGCLLNGKPIDVNANYWE